MSSSLITEIARCKALLGNSCGSRNANSSGAGGSGLVVIRYKT